MTTLVIPYSAGEAQTLAPSAQGESLPSAIEQLLRQRPLRAESQVISVGNSTVGIRVESSPPADDAPIEDLIEYWSRRSSDRTKTDLPGPSDIVRERLLGAGERRPWTLPRLYDFLPKNTDTHDRLYRVLTKDPKEFDEIEENNWRSSLYWWLQSNTQYLRNELIEAVRTRDNNDSDKLDEIEALAKLDWHTAKPLLERIVAAGMSRSYPIALSQLYEGSVKGTDMTQAEAYRASLKRLIVEDGLAAAARRTILSSLLKEDWAGQEEWFVSLFSDPNLSRQNQSRMTVITGASFIAGRRVSGSSRERDFQRMYFTSDPIPLSIALNLNPGKWIPVIAGLTSHKEAAIRNAAVTSLGVLLNNNRAEKKYREEAARTLLPWLTDPNWGPEQFRANFISMLAEIDLPESIPGLLWVLDNEKDDFTRESVVESLRRHCDSRIGPALKGHLSIVSNEELRWQIVTALAKCGGFSDEEMASAIEAYANMATTTEGQALIGEISEGKSGKILPLNVFIGQTLFQSDLNWATEGFAAILFDRLKEAPPAAATRILNKIRALPLNIARARLVERIGNSSANIADLTLALRIRDLLADDLRVELSELVKRGGYASGVAAITLKDRDRQIEILKGKDAKAQIALLAGARYLLEKLPIESLKGLTTGSDKTLTLAVESYLEIDGGAAARKLILTRRPDEFKIAGDITCLAGYQNELGELKAWEETLRGEMLAPGGVDEIYALAPAVPSKRLKGMVIRARRGRAEISVYDAAGGQKTRVLSESEFRELKDFTSRPEVEELGPESWRINKPIIPYEYLRLTKEGGKRIILAGFGSAPKSQSSHEKLADLFYRISKSSDKLR
ncbi:MAG TPA: HEAT repeat domain-containing protein [Blastocatellia bacterium]|nr:HEAT repeat domain-containing protein [Blastocatellia bacterium]